MEPILLIALLVTVLCICVTLKFFHAKKYSNLPPGSLGWPILGESLEFLSAGREGDPVRFIQERVLKCGSDQVFKTSMMGEKMAVFCGPAGNKFLFGNENKLVKVWWPASVRKLFGRCLLTSAAEEAKWMRKMLSSFLSPDAFTRLYITTMELVTQAHFQTHWQGKEQLKVYQTVKLYTFELACRLFVSLEDPKHIAKLATQFNILLKGIIEIPLNIPGTRFYRAMRAAAAIRKELFAIIKERRVALNEKTALPSQDLLSHLLVSSDENGKFLTDAEIVNNILVLLFAGHDTSSATITLLMKKLGELPHVYDKVLEEQMDIAASKEAGELLQWEDIQKMKYSWCVVSEVMRLHPPVLGAFREALVDFTYAGYTIPKGWKLYWSTVWTHNDQNFFPNTENFDSSRFEGAGPTPFTYVPFGGGPRMCLGKEFARLEILVFLHNLVKRFKWDLLIPDEKIEYDPMSTPVKGLPIRLRPHKH
ncbi:hypothetical protein LguiB_032027 [Lonicera macranthoides]